MARQRDYHAEYLRRQELAAERFPDLSRSERTAIARGHRSTADLERTLRRPGKIADADVVATQGPDGRYAHIDVIVTMTDGTQRTFRLRGKQASSAELRKLATRLKRSGVRVAGIEYLAGKRKGKAA